MTKNGRPARMIVDCSAVSPSAPENTSNDAVTRAIATTQKMRWPSGL